MGSPAEHGGDGGDGDGGGVLAPTFTTHSHGPGNMACVDALALALLVAFACAFVAMRLSLPPLVGFLVAGFGLSAAGWDAPDELAGVSELGIVVLLFTVGLKLDLRQVTSRVVWTTTAAHMAVTTAVGVGLAATLAAAGVGLLAGLDLGTLLLVGFAVSFSSTVFAVKLLDERGTTSSRHGRIAIGVLILQDLAAVAFLAASEGELPSPWAVGLVALWPLGRMLRRLWSRIDHGEMQVLLGMTAAIGLGYAGFDAIGLKGDLGALVAGAMLAGHPSATEMGRRVATVRDLLLVGFFLELGLGGLPGPGELGVALALVALVPLKAWGYAALLRPHRVGGPTQVQTGMTLASHSEFGLVVAAGAAAEGLLAPEWLTVMAVAVAVSFVVAAAASRSEAASRALAATVPGGRSEAPDVDHEPSGRTPVAVWGLGRVGRATAERLRSSGTAVLVVDQDEDRIARARAGGLVAVVGDATDPAAVDHVLTHEPRVVVLALSTQGAALVAVEHLRAAGFTGEVVAVARHEDEAVALEAAGCQTVHRLHQWAGWAVADALDPVDAAPPDPAPPRGTSRRRSARRAEQGGDPVSPGAPPAPPEVTI